MDDIYIIALTFSGEVETEFAGLRAAYRQFVDYDIVPHLTLAFPFSPLDGIETVYAALENYARTVTPFDIVMEKVDYFDGANRGAYVTVKEPAPVRALNLGVIGALEGFIKKYHADYDYETFLPHMTIAEKLPPEEYAAIRQRFNGTAFNRTVTMAGFSLFRKNGTAYHQERRFALRGGT